MLGAPGGFAASVIKRSVALMSAGESVFAWPHMEAIWKLVFTG